MIGICQNNSRSLLRNLTKTNEEAISITGMAKCSQNHVLRCGD